MYPIIDVSGWTLYQAEPIGTKAKDWLISPDDQGTRWLVKWNRIPKGGPHPGEDWSEKVAAEVAALMGLPHARVEFAVDDEGRLGVLSRSFVPDPEQVRLTHGNELMARLQDDYPIDGCRDNRCYTVQNVIRVLAASAVGLPGLQVPSIPYPSGILEATDVFVGYLALDALVGNGDRHDQNWAILEVQGRGAEPALAELAPTFDHATSLGRELSDHKRRCRVGVPDDAPQGSISQYASKNRSAFYPGPEGDRLTTCEAFVVAATPRPLAAASWVSRLEALTDDRLSGILDAVPEQRMSADARLFVRRFIRYNLGLLRKATLEIAGSK